MKKLFLLILFCLGILATISCRNSNNLEKKNKSESENNPKVSDTSRQKDIQADCSTIANFFIEQSKAEDLMGHFEKLYQKKGSSSEVRELVDSFWIDACLIGSLRKFFYDSSKSGYDGIRIYSIFNKPVIVKKRSDIVIVPTILKNNIHLSKWGTRVPLINNCKPKFKNFNWEESKANRKRDDFETDLRNEKYEGDTNGIDSLSKGIWFSRCVIDSLSKYLSDPVYDLDGVYIHCAAYKSKDNNRDDQKYPNQSTFLFVLTESDKKGGHNQRWDVIKGLPWVIEKLYNGGYNHGELCPQKCEQ